MPAAPLVPLEGGKRAPRRLWHQYEFLLTSVEKISIALTPDMAATVRQAVKSGDYASASEVVRDALRDWQLKRAVDQELILELRRLWQEGIASGLAWPFDMAAIKRGAKRNRMFYQRMIRVLIDEYAQRHSQRQTP